MRLWRIALTALALFCLAPARCARAEARVLNLLGWGDYFDPRILDEFTRSTGIRIVYDAYLTREAAEARLRGPNDYDVVVLPAPSLRALIPAGALRRLDRGKLAGAGNLSPEIMARLAAFDTGGQYGVPYLWQTMGLAYDVEQAKAKLGDAAVDSLDLIFRPERVAAFADCGVAVPDSAEDMFALALRWLRLDPASRNPADLRRGADLLGALRRNVKSFYTGGLAGALANGDICLAIGWSGDALQARAWAKEAGEDVEIAYAAPKEGAPILIDALAIPNGAPHGEAALAFIEFLLRPDVAARNTNATRFANGVPASRPMIARDIAENPAIYPGAAMYDRLFAGASADPAAQKFIAREWSRIRTGR